MEKNQFWFQSLFILICLLLTGFIGLIGNGEDSSEAMKKLTPFIGKWKTISVYTDNGLKVHGELEYRWVLGNNWILVEFIGQHPERAFWEAYAMIKFDPLKKLYISYDFFNADDPIVMVGYWISKRTIRFEIKNEKRSSGIDYTVKEDGSIFQENWIFTKGKTRKITLKTEYIKANA